MADLRLAFDAATVFQFSPEAHIGIGGRHHGALHSEHTAAGGDRRFEAARDRREGREKQVAEAVTFQAGAGAEAVLEQACEQRLLGGQGRQAIADVAGGQHAELAAQHPGAAAVVRHGDDGGEVAAVALQAAEQGGQAGAAADGHDRRAAVQPPLGGQGIHQECVFFRGERFLDGAETAALAQPDQAAAHQQHQRPGDLPRQHLGDVLQRPADRLQQPIDRLQISPNGRAEQRQQQADA